MKRNKNRRMRVYINPDSAFFPSLSTHITKHEKSVHIKTMCRTHQVQFEVCGHQESAFNKTFRCANQPHCGPAEIVPHRRRERCSGCYWDLREVRTPPNYRNVATFLRSDNDHVMQRARRVFELAARPGERYRTFPVEVNDIVLLNGVEETIYDPLNLHEFSGTLTRLEEMWLRLVECDLASYILMPGLQAVTITEYRIFCQIRAANIGRAMTLHEADNYQQGPEMIRRLNAVMTPMLILQAQDNPDCPIFQEPLEQAHVAGEEAVKLPCSHIVGRQCIETWVIA